MLLIWQMSDKKRYFNLLKYLFLCLSFSFSFYSHKSLANCQISKVDEWTGIKKIIDGDTIVISDGRKVRFIGINTPEMGRNGEASEPFAMQALLELKLLLNHETKIGLTYGKQKKDKYKRLLAHPSLPDGRSVASVLLKQGLAVSIVVPPNDHYLSCYRKFEQQPRSKQRGLWQLPENQIIAAGKLSSKAKGYRFVSGTIKQYKTSKKSIYLQLNKKLAIRISKQDLKYFKRIDLKKLKGSKVIVRGWVSTYKGRQSIHVSHADNIKVETK
jgi:endonuclease YncB( thermonuclease family)